MSNRILAGLSRADFALLEPKLEAVALPIRKQLHARSKRIQHVYFPDSGIASVVANGDRALEIGIIGRDGMTGVAVIMGSNERAPHEVFVQVAGNARRLSADHLCAAIDAVSACTGPYCTTLMPS